MRWALLILVLAGAFVGAILLDRSAGRADLTVAYVSLQTLDPTRMQASEDIRVAYALFEGLTTFDPFTFSVQPGVAHRWEVSPDGLCYTFHLRPDARWSNGDRLTSADFLAAWRQNMMPDFASEYHSFLLYIRGASDFVAACTDSLEKGPGRAVAAAKLFEKLVAVQAPDDHTLIVHLAQPTTYFPDIVACWPLFPLHKSVIDSATVNPDTGLLQRDPKWTKHDRIISNGPYRLERWRFKQELLLTRNDHYWQPWPDMPRTVRMVCIPDATASFNAFISGAIDLQLGATPAFLADLVAQARAGQRHDVHTVNNWGTYYYAFNCRPLLSDGQPNPFADVRVRQAFAMTIDKRAIVEKVTRLHQQIASSFMPPDSFEGYPTPAGLRGVHDATDESQRKQIIAQARQLLVDAGFGPERPFPTLVLMYNTGGGHESAAQAIASMWKQSLGVDVQFKTHEWKVFLDEYSNGRFMVARASWFGDYGDPTTFLDLLKTGNSNNNPAFSHAPYDALLDQARGMIDARARLGVLARAEAIAMNEQVPIVPLYHYMLVHLYNPDRLTGVSTHPRGMQFFHRMSVRRPAESGTSP